MDMIDRINQPALQKRQELLQQRASVDSSLMHDLSKSHPYYGYIDIKIGTVDPFLMFSNNDDFVARTFFWSGADAYEKTSLKLWSELARACPVVLDIGSYTGVYSLVAAKANRNCRVYAFEALDRIYSRLVINRQVNQASNLQVFNKAVSNSAGQLEFNVYSGESILASGSSLLEKKTTRTVYEKKTVTSVSIDDFGAAEGLGRVGLMKIDAEGAEHLVLDGAKETIRRHCPDILVELLKDADLNALHNVIGCHPYSYYQLDDVSGRIDRLPELRASSGMHNLNTLITCKSLDEVMRLAGAAA